NELRVQQRNTQNSVEETESNIAVLKERRSNLQKQQKQAAEHMDKLKKQLDESETQIVGVNVEHGKLQESISTQEKELNMAQNRADEVTQHATDAEKAVEDLKTQTINLLNRKAKAQNELSSADGRLDYLIARSERLLTNAQNYRKEKAGLKNELTNLQKNLDESESQIKSLRDKQDEIEKRRRELQSRVEHKEKEFRELERQRNAKSSRLQSLQELQQAYEGYSTGVRNILGKAKKSKDSSFHGICGTVAEIIRTQPKYELALESALGNNVQGIVMDTLDDSLNVLEYLRNSKNGRATLFSLENMKNENTQNQNPLIDGILASELVEYDEKYKYLISYLLDKTFIVKDITTAISLLKSILDDNKNDIKFVTLDGQVILSNGSITGGTGSESAGLLRRSREIDELKKQLVQSDNNLKKLNNQLSEMKKQVSSLRKEHEEITRDIQKRQIKYTGVQKDVSQSQQRLDRLDKEISVINSESGELEREIVKLEQNKERLQEEAQKLEKQSAEITKKINILQEEYRQKAQQRDAFLQQCTNMKVQLASKKQQVKGIQERLKSLERDRDKIAQNLDSYQKSVTSDKDAVTEIESQIKTKENSLEKLFQKRTDIEKEISRNESIRQKAQVDLTKGEASLKDYRKESDQIKQEKYQLEVTRTQLQLNLDSLVNRMQERYGISLDDLKKQDEKELTYEENEEDLVNRIEEIRQRMEKMGSVNLAAVDEYNRQKERYDLLVTQKEDLTKAKNSLYNIIQRINRESRDRLQETFESVNTNFQELFKQLFGGGQAELVMVGEEDVLESGVDVIARPPDKKPQSIAMLSSGERTLTAIAILFALFRIKPSPFCLLDEVDAALDDANVGRFTSMLKEFSRNTQFVIITHNKRTMEIANVLYGVTMEESGISKLVSLKIDDEKQESTSQAAAND
ncbi:chromosome segregation protein SMC, partial [Candidatus Poribacteria bacterium]|nr:chromosome segregation protein SMC [Candidatus Poribacteria bacterium]